LKCLILDLGDLSEAFKLSLDRVILKSKTTNLDSTKLQEYTVPIINLKFIYENVRIQRDIGSQLLLINDQLSSDSSFLLGWLFSSILMIEHHFYEFSQLENEKSPRIAWSVLYKIKWQLRTEMYRSLDFDLAGLDFEINAISDTEIIKKLIFDLQKVVNIMIDSEPELSSSSTGLEALIQGVEQDHFLDIKLKLNYKFILQQHLFLGYKLFFKSKSSFDYEWAFLGWSLTSVLVIQDFNSKIPLDTTGDEIIKLKFDLLLRAFDEYLFGLQSGR
jgi:hypothetical protein